MNLKTMSNKLDKLQKFKDYVHGRLDSMNVPKDPDPVNTVTTGCRIQGRLDYVGRKLQILKDQETAKKHTLTGMDTDGDL